MLCIYESRVTARLLHLGNDMQSNGSLTGGFRPEYLDNTSARHAADAQCRVQRQRAGMHRLHRHVLVLAQLHDGALAEVALDLLHRRPECLALCLPIRLVCHHGCQGFLCLLLCRHICCQPFCL